ncbi:MAG: hypothetical protein QOF74_6974 [Caballeronia mineralivorans]|jgi:hypothetical protein|nr:hypothetical protein [Caballeronia mineralivorans]
MAGVDLTALPRKTGDLCVVRDLLDELFLTRCRVLP